MSNPPPTPNPERGVPMAHQPPIPSEPAGQGPRPTPRVLPGTALPLTWHWLIPVLCALFLEALLAEGWWRSGPLITVRFSDGHGLKAQDPVKHRGIIIGTVRTVVLAPDLDGVIVTAVLQPEAVALTRTGSRFFVVRPQVGLYGVQGLDTVIGTRYLAVLPGDGPPCREFRGLDEPPARQIVASGSLEIVLVGGRRGSVRPGTPILFRQIAVGTVQNVALTADAIGVEMRAVIDPPYVKLVRTNSRFWNAGGIDINLGLLRGLDIDIESIQSVLAGGIVMATPDGAGPLAANGHRFELADRADHDANRWAPALPVDTDRSSRGPSPRGPTDAHPTAAEAAAPVRPVRVVCRTTEQRWGGFWQAERTRSGWGIPLPSGLLVPIDLIGRTRAAPVGADAATVVLIAGRVCPGPVLAAATVLASGTFALLPAPTWAEPATVPTVAPEQWRRTNVPEEAQVFTPDDHAPLPLTVARMTGDGDRWRLDANLRIPPSHHGAPVWSASDGRLIGVLVGNDGGRWAVAPLAGLSGLP